MLPANDGPHAPLQAMPPSLQADPERLRHWVKYLAEDIGPRPYSKPRLLRKVADGLGRAFRDLGYRVEEQAFAYRGEIYYNVSASPPVAKETAHPLVVIGAHYDTVAATPGADDNASGVAGLMELARLAAASPPAHVRFVAFALEEPPVFRSRHMGSFIYAKELKRRQSPLQGMMSLEMIGYFRDQPKSQSFPFFFMDRIYPDRGDFIALVGNTKSRAWTGSVKRAFASGTDLPVERLNAPWFVLGVDFSDHWAFSRFGYPAVMVTDTAFYRNPHYHRPSDRPKTLDFRRAAQVVDGLLAVIGATAP